MPSTYQLLWTTAAKGTLRIGANDHLLIPFRLFFLHPGEEWAFPGDPLALSQLTFEVEALQQLWARYPEDRQLPIYEPGAVRFLDLEPDELLPVSILHRLTESLDQDKRSGRLFGELRTGILLHIADAYRRRHPRLMAADIQKLLALIGQQFKTQRRSSWYAAQLGLRPRRLNARARAVTGKLVEELVMDRLYQEAEALLRIFDLPVKTIAYELGFGDPSHFNRFFYKRAGVRPLAYRQQLLESAGKRT
jgi:AraC-like DNA-binding protein